MDLADRLQARLREVAAQRFPGEAAPVATVADLYQQLIPYRAVRAELGILELAEYEHALLRLLAGERGSLRLRDEDAQRELRRELGSPNPILGLYRDYAAVEVVLLPADRTLPAATAAPTAPPVPVPDVPPPPLPEPEAAPPAPAATTCRSCRCALPAADQLRFCPFCGVNQWETACPQCGSMLQPDWSFCIRCGAPHPERPRRA